MNERIKENDPYRKSRLLYIIQAALEYFVSIIVAGAYLAKVTTAVGMSEGMTGVLSSFVSLGCGMQLIALFLTRVRSTKRLVVGASVINQLLFAVVYLTPFLPDSMAGGKSIVLLISLLLAHFVMNAVHSPKIGWLMSLVDDHHRGVFTAKKEMVSLLGGMLFTFLMGSMMDAFEAKGNQKGAFIFCAIAISVLCLFHTLVLLLTKEREEKRTVAHISFKAILGNKSLLKVTLFSVLWHIVNYISLPFYGAYQIGALGFSMTFVSLLSIISSLARSACSLPMGRFADKHSFANALILCFGVKALSFVAVTFTNPSTGYILYPVYMVLQAVALSGINSGTINLVYDYVPSEGRVAALAMQNSIAGVAGFLTTLAVSPFVDYVKAQGNVFLGIHAYPQQILSFVSAVGSVGIIFYLVFVIRKIRRPEETEIKE
ncbi:MAG: MFS transporter [Clostridia bacterium]|nr:MFS transporter [Clostridia bacterium]